MLHIKSICGFGVSVMGNDWLIGLWLIIKIIQSRIVTEIESIASVSGITDK